MNLSMVRYILGYVLTVEGILMQLCCVVGLIYREAETLGFLLVGASAMTAGLLLRRKKPKNTVFYLKEGCVSTALSWILMSAVGALPFLLTGEIRGFTNAMFEISSGFTTTGASILSDVEALSQVSLFWRSFTHWIGGMGVLVFVLAVVPLSGDSHIHLMRAESPGPSVGKFVPKVRSTARILYAIYIGLTLCELIFLLLGGLPLFDSLTVCFGTAGTGGFAVRNASIGDYSVYIQWVVTIFMALFGVNFNAYYLILLRQFKAAFSMEEVRLYFIVMTCGTGAVFFSILRQSPDIFDALTKALFQSVSIMTTTGFSTADFDLWPQPARLTLVMLMFAGACACSTGGGIKISRFLILGKTVRKEFGSYLHPRSVKKIKMDGKAVERDIVRSTNVYFITYVFVFSVSLFLVTLEGQDLVTGFAAVAATMNNIGPGLRAVGPTCNYGGLVPLSKWVLIFDMLAGRLELFPMLMLFHPALLKQALERRRKPPPAGGAA